MAVHIFVVNEANYKICVRKGIVGLPEPKESRTKWSIFDGLLSRIACIKENDYILMYVTGSQELRGVWKADGLPFYDTSKIWDDKTYPFRCGIIIKYGHGHCSVRRVQMLCLQFQTGSLKF